VLAEAGIFAGERAVRNDPFVYKCNGLPYVGSRMEARLASERRLSRECWLEPFRQPNGHTMNRTYITGILGIVLYLIGSLRVLRQYERGVVCA
jgi:hypothetical protein